MNPFPANSLDDTENEQPLSELTSSQAVSSSAQVPAAADNAVLVQNLPNHQPEAMPQRRNNVSTPPPPVVTTPTPPTPSNGRHSWPGQRWTQTARQTLPQESLSFFWRRESLAVAVWALTVPLLSLVVVRLQEKADKLHEWQQQGDYLRVILGIFAWLVLRPLPTAAPGFFVSNVWVLLRLYERYGRYPHLGCRLCEWRLGRLSKHAMGLAVLVHVLVPFGVWGLLSLVSSDFDLNAESALYAPQYDEDDDEKWLVHVSYEVLANTLFPILVMVVPALLKLNDLPEWLTLLFLYPLYSLRVDAAGRGSSLCASAYLAQALLRSCTSMSSCRLAGQMLGHALAGTLMQKAFPDEPTM